MCEFLMNRPIFIIFNLEQINSLIFWYSLVSVFRSVNLINYYDGFHKLVRSKRFDGIEQ